MSQIAHARARHVRLISNGQVLYLGSHTHKCKRCRLTWDPTKVGPLCPDCDAPEGDVA